MGGSLNPVPPNGKYFFAIHVIKESDEKKTAAQMFKDYSVRERERKRERQRDETIFRESRTATKGFT